MSMKTATRIVSAAAAAVCVLAVVSAPAQAKAKAKATGCTRSLKLDTKGFSAKLALGAKVGFADNAVARARLKKGLRSATARYNASVKSANGLCTRSVKQQGMVRDAAMRRASTTLARTVVRQKYAAGIAYVQAQREQGVYQAFLGWMLEVQNTYVDYDKRTTSAGTAAAKNTFRDSTGAAIAAMRQHLLTATAAYQAARSTAISQKTAALAAANSSSDAQAKSVATLSAWDAYVRAMVAAQRNALKDRSASLPEASDALAAAHAEFEHETEPAGPITNGPEPTDSPEATPAP